MTSEWGLTSVKKNGHWKATKQIKSEWNERCIIQEIINRQGAITKTR